VNKQKATKIIAYKNAGNSPFFQTFWKPSKSEALGLSLFSLMVNPRLYSTVHRAYPSWQLVFSVLDLL